MAQWDRWRAKAVTIHATVLFRLTLAPWPASL